MKKSLVRAVSAGSLKIRTSLHRVVVRQNTRAMLSRLRPRRTTRPLIRIGGDKDGGYLIPNDFTGIGAVFSPGVDVTASFEEYFLGLGIPCFLMDASVKKPPIAHPLLSFRRSFLGPVSSRDYLSLEDWIMDFTGRGEFILQLDIEGDEWEVLSKLEPEVLLRFRFIVLELHGLASKLRKHSSGSYVEKAIEKLTKHHTAVHFHPNNCCGNKDVYGQTVPEVAEITLVRSDVPYLKRRFASLPHVLDRENVPGDRLPSPWEK